MPRKNADPKPAAPAFPPWLGAAILVLAIAAAYANSLRAPFVFDDAPAILENPSIQHGLNPAEVLAPQRHGGLPVGGRPIANLSFAVNWTLHEDRPTGYHVMNLFIHAAAALALYGLVRRTLSSALLAPRFGAQAGSLALLAALIWAVHPLQTAAITYVSQRVEALAGMFQLLTLYAFARAATASPPRPWLVASAAACALGAATKEVMAVAPLLVLLYDRTFFAGTFRAALARRPFYYASLAGTWVLLAVLVASTGGRGGTAGFGSAVTPWTYLLTQCGAIVQYLRLSVWPAPLVFDYGTATVGGLGDVWWQAAGLVGLAAATAWALVRRPVWGFVGAWFFLLLAPSSSLVPVVTQTMAEHRMYLALAAVMVPAVMALQAWFGRGAWVAGGAVALAFASATVARNQVYRTVESLWTDTVAKAPANARAHHNLAIELARQGRLQEAVAEYEETLRLSPDDPEAHNNLGNHLAAIGRPREALREFHAALRLKPGLFQAHNNIGNLLLGAGRPVEALASYQEALRLEPNYAEANYNAGNALVDLGRQAEAVPYYERALRTRPKDVATLTNLATVLLELRRQPEAIARYEQALKVEPSHEIARRNVVIVLQSLGRRDEALRHCEEFLRWHPQDAAMQRKRAELER